MDMLNTAGKQQNFFLLQEMQNELQTTDPSKFNDYESQISGYENNNELSILQAKWLTVRAMLKLDPEFELDNPNFKSILESLKMSQNGQNLDTQKQYIKKIQDTAGSPLKSVKSTTNNHRSNLADTIFNLETSKALLKKVRELLSERNALIENILNELNIKIDPLTRGNDLKKAISDAISRLKNEHTDHGRVDTTPNVKNNINVSAILKSLNKLKNNYVLGKLSCYCVMLCIFTITSAFLYLYILKINIKSFFANFNINNTTNKIFLGLCFGFVFFLGLYIMIRVKSCSSATAYDNLIKNINNIGKPTSSYVVPKQGNTP